MMDFDQLVRKYLSGSLTDAELDEFRDLLQRVPEYRVELRQILELRSLIHDDTLKLNPPDELSNSVRTAVGSNFAQTGTEAMLRFDAQSLTPPPDLSNSVRLAVGRKFAEGMQIEEPKKKRRKGLVWIPYRIAAGAFATASIAVILAVAPTLFAPFGNRDGEGASRVARVERAAPAPGSGGLAALPAPPSNTPSIASLPGQTEVSGSATAIARGTGSVGVERAGVPASDGGRSERRFANRTGGGSVASAAVPLTRAVDAPKPEEPAPLNEKRDGGNIADILPPSDRPPILDIDAFELLKPVGTVNSRSTYNPAPDTANMHVAPITPASSIAMVRSEIAGKDRRLLAIGVTLGSGSVDATSPTVLMGSSCYFSFSVSGQDRVGVEMGGSTFQQENQSSLFGGFAKQSQFGKQVQGMPSDEPAEAEPAKNPSNPIIPTTPKSSQRLKQQITYGGVFYDRRVLKIDDKWDLCGRVTFGGADGSLVSSVRAYGSFSPSKNVSLTMGVGGSALYDLSSKKSWGSGNYGIYYGVETGF